MPQHWPSPEEREAERQRLEAIRPWHRAAFWVLLIVLVLALFWQFERLGVG